MARSRLARYAVFSKARIEVFGPRLQKHVVGCQSMMVTSLFIRVQHWLTDEEVNSETQYVLARVIGVHRQIAASSVLIGFRACKLMWSFVLDKT